MRAPRSFQDILTSLDNLDTLRVPTRVPLPILALCTPLYLDGSQGRQRRNADGAGGGYRTESHEDAPQQNAFRPHTRRAWNRPSQKALTARGVEVWLPSDPQPSIAFVSRGRRARRRAISPRNRKRWRTPLRSRPRCAKQQQSMMTDYKLATTFFRRPPLRPRGTAADEPVAALRECDTRTRRTRWAESWGFPPIMPTLQRATAQREAAGDAAPKEREHGGELLSGVRERCNRLGEDRQCRPAPMGHFA